MVTDLWCHLTYNHSNFFIKDIDDCARKPCLHGGVCTDGVNRFTCSCAPGYAGKTCDISKLDVLLQPM